MKLFIDDERFPVSNDWVIVRTSAEAKAFVIDNGVPDEIAFDHDLGGSDTSMIFVNWLINHMLDNKIYFPVGFSYSIHSQNPVGAANIKERMDFFVKNIADYM